MFPFLDERCSFDERPRYSHSKPTYLLKLQVPSQVCSGYRSLKRFVELEVLGVHSSAMLKSSTLHNSPESGYPAASGRLGEAPYDTHSDPYGPIPFIHIVLHRTRRMCVNRIHSIVRTRSQLTAFHPLLTEFNLSFTHVRPTYTWLPH